VFQFNIAELLEVDPMAIITLMAKQALVEKPKRKRELAY
jgi:hypothetical protein